MAAAAARTTIRFLLGDEPVQLAGLDPTRTVLEWLREDVGRCGTKEGCAEGDCGACTVVLGRLRDGALRYEAVNACILFLPMLDGCQLLTVEDLRAPDGALHPVQQALVAHHGSQCGFCTPGFVMSLFAHVHEPQPAPIDDVLAGNLCRCTGYGPIVRAAAALPHAAPDPAVAERLAALDDRRALALEHGGRRFLAPRTVDGLAEALRAEPDATVLAGATDVGLWVTKQLRRLESVVWLGRVEELARIEEGAGAIRIGAGATWRDAAPVLGRLWPDFGEVLRRFGGVQVRNAATVGGNVANGSPIGDSLPCLIALGAEVLLRRGHERRRLPLEDLYLAYGVQARVPGEFVEGIEVPQPAAGDVFRAYKISKRFGQDISAVCAALRLRFEKDHVAEARVAFGGMAATPKRASAAEAALIGRRWDEAAARAAATALADDFSPIDDMRASAAYRLTVARNLLRRAAVETAAPASATRLVGIGALDV